MWSRRLPPLYDYYLYTAPSFIRLEKEGRVQGYIGAIKNVCPNHTPWDDSGVVVQRGLDHRESGNFLVQINQLTKILLQAVDKGCGARAPCPRRELQSMTVV